MNRKVEITVGLFMVIVICSILFLCFRVTDATSFTNHSTYRVYAVFDDIGGLKARSPIKIGGVVIGRINDITLKNYKPYVSMDIDSQYNEIPSSSNLSVKTSGLLGEQFIAVSLGIKAVDAFDIDAMDANDRGVAINENNKDKIPPYFEENFVVNNTNPAVSLEDLIGKLVFSMSQGDDKTTPATGTSNTNEAVQ